MIEIVRVEGEAYLCHQYASQQQRQPCYLWIDPGATPPRMGCEWDGEIGWAVPMAVYHGRLLRVPIPCLRGSAANRLLTEASPLAARVVAGYSVAWDGSNMVGHLTDDARVALDEIEAMATQYDGEEHTLSAWSAGDWLNGCEIGGGDTAASLEAAALGHGVVLTDAADYVERVREADKAD